MSAIQDRFDGITADFSEFVGQIRKRLHCSNYAPNLSRQNIRDFSEAFRELHFTEARNHDWALSNPGQRMIDTHFVFPNIKADPADPDNYYFDSSDAVIENCRNCGTEVYYRLGTSIEHTRGRHFNALMPADFEHYAEVLAGIIRHYNRGWANGFHWNIRYWEIWNEADLGALMWSGTLEEYERFFIVVFKRLKSEFPELKIGGPAYTSLDEKIFRPLLENCRRNGVEPDFLSWHSYASDPVYMVQQPEKARRLVDEFGFTRTELHLNEWHYLETFEGLHSNVTEASMRHHLCERSGLNGIDSAAFNLFVLSNWHDTPLDAAYYYGADFPSLGFLTPFHGWNKNYYSMKMFSKIVSECPARIRTAGGNDSRFALGAKSADGRTGVLLAGCYRGADSMLRFRIRGMEGAALSALLLDDSHDLVPVELRREGGDWVLEKNDPGSAAVLLEFNI